MLLVSFCFVYVEAAIEYSISSFNQKKKQYEYTMAKSTSLHNISLQHRTESKTFQMNKVVLVRSPRPFFYVRFPTVGE
jgi:hypothetical protein